MKCKYTKPMLMAGFRKKTPLHIASQRWRGEKKELKVSLLGRFRGALNHSKFFANFRKSSNGFV